MNKNIESVPTYPEYPTNSFERHPSEKILANTLETPSEPVIVSNTSMNESNAVPPAVSIFSLSFIEYLGMIGICVFIIFIVTEAQYEYQERKQSYLIKTNAKAPSFAEIFENMKTNFITNINAFFNNSFEYLKTKYEELNYTINKWKVNSHLENKTLKTIDISYYKDKYK
jgi:hypothetical protein